MYATTRILGIVLIAAGLSACGGGSSYQPATGLSTEQLYAEACSGCHGKTGGGKFGFLFSIVDSEMPVNEIVDKIRNGGQMMPAFPQISETQATEIAAYVKGL